MACTPWDSADRSPSDPVTQGAATGEDTAVCLLWRFLEITPTLLELGALLSTARALTWSMAKTRGGLEPLTPAGS